MSNIDPVWPERETTSVHVECQKRIRELEGLLKASTEVRNKFLSEIEKLEQENVALRAEHIHRCSICSTLTNMACSDCRIDLRTTVYVCTKSACRDEHEKICPSKLRAENERYEKLGLERIEWRSRMGLSTKSDFVEENESLRKKLEMAEEVLHKVENCDKCDKCIDIASSYFEENKSDDTNS